MKKITPPPARESSIEDVAKLAGVSCASVSRVVNRLGNVSSKMEERVRRAIEELHYRPNSYSRTLRSGKTNTVAIYRTSLAQKDELYSETLIQKLTSQLSSQNYRVVLELLRSQPDGRHTLDGENGPNREVDGICVVGHTDQADLEVMSRWDLPVCLLNLTFDHPNFISVSLADSAGSAEAVQYLFALGRRKIAFVYGNLQWPGPRGRLEGYREAHRKFAVPMQPEFLVQVDLDEQNYTGGFHAVEKLLQLPDRPDAILFVNDWYAVGGLAALRQHGVRVPEEISIIGFDDSWLAPQVLPPLSTISLEPEELCSVAVEALLKKIEQRPLLRSEYLIRPRLMVRQSCSPLHRTEPVSRANAPEISP